MQNSQKEILCIAQEECAEVIQVISKIFRFGFDSKHPKQSANNLERLEEEIGDLMCMINLMIDRGMINESKIVEAQGRKFEKLKKWSGIFDENSL
jgi:NTP pyrophosphatase (non-canonical NTP hydrolase)